MSILDLLLQTDIEKLKTDNCQNVEVKRLSKILGEKFIVTCYPLTHEDITHIGEISKTNSDIKLNAIFEACRIEGSRFNSSDLMNKFGTLSAKELISKLFLPGEVAEIYNVVNKISGYSKNAVEEVKKN